VSDRWLDEAVRLRRENTPPGTSWQHAADDNARLEVTLCDECETALNFSDFEEDVRNEVLLTLGAR